jgi:hypothetical protein
MEMWTNLFTATLPVFAGFIIGHGRLPDDIFTWGWLIGLCALLFVVYQFVDTLHK